MSNPKRKALWNGPPPPPSLEVTSKDASCQGILGSSLRQALRELKAKKIDDGKYLVSDDENDNGEKVSDEQEKSSQIKNKILEDEDFIANVLNAFGRAVAETHTEQYQMSLNHHKKGATPNLPKASLQGRLQCYNRHGAKWRIALTNARFHRRKTCTRFGVEPLRVFQQKDTVKERQTAPQTCYPEITFDRIEVLAYNDTKEE